MEGPCLGRVGERGRMEIGKADEGPAKRRGGAEAVTVRSAKSVSPKVSRTNGLEPMNRNRQNEKCERGSVPKSLKTF